MKSTETYIAYALRYKFSGLYVARPRWVKAGWFRKKWMYPGTYDWQDIMLWRSHGDALHARNKYVHDPAYDVVTVTISIEGEWDVLGH